jgi:gluconate 5-dehydrogenase
MIAKGHGKIINICSMMSELGRETVSAYAAAKGGLKMLTRNICSEYGDKNIQCNGIGPGYIATPQTAPLRERQPDGSRHPFDAFIVAKTPAGRWGTPEDLKGPAVFLASEASDFVKDTSCTSTAVFSPYIASSLHDRRRRESKRAGFGSAFLCLRT